MFQSPQWGDNSKVDIDFDVVEELEFQSPQWGDNSKVNKDELEKFRDARFSPRNGEIILKFDYFRKSKIFQRFSPRNGEIILKIRHILLRIVWHSFSPRNGEIILKLYLNTVYVLTMVSVPAMGR